jgi:translocation and assembly module TamB
MSFDAAAHRIQGAGDYALTLRFDAKRMDAALKVNEPASGPLENLLALPGLGPLAATLNLSGPRSAEKLDLSIDAGELRGRAQGTFNLTELAADADFSLESPALRPRPDLGWERASIKGRWHGSIKTPTADGHVDIDQLRLPGDTQMATLNADFSASLGHAEVHALIGGLRIPGSQPQLLESSPLKIDASMRLNETALPVDLAASHRLFTLNAHADTAGLMAGKKNVTLELQLPDLGTFAALVGQHAGGTAVVKARLVGDAGSTQVLLDASAASLTGTESWSAAVGDRATLQVSGALTDKALNLESMQLTGRAMSLSASGSESRAAPGAAGTPALLHLKWDLTVSDLETLSSTLAGNARVAGTLDGPITAMAAQAELTSSVAVRGSPSGSLSAQIKMRGLPSAPSGTLEAEGALDGAPLSVDVALERSAAGTVRVLVHRADWKSAHADGDLTVATSGGQSHGQLRLQMRDLADLQHLLGLNVAGSLTGNVTLRPDRERTHAHFDLDARDLALGQLKGNAQASGDGGTDALGLKLDVQLPALRGAAASVSAAGSLRLGAHELRVADVAANYLGQDLRLLSPAKVTFDSGVSIDHLALGAGEAVLELGGRISPALDLHVALRQVKPSLINAFAPGLLQSGTIEGHAELKGSVASPTGPVRLTATGMQLADDAALGLPALDLEASANLEGNTAEIDARLTAGTQSKLTVTGHAPLAADGELDLKLGGTLDVGMINPLLEARGQHAAGALAIDATVDGSVGAPEIGGTVTLTKGSLRDYVRGVSITDIAADVVGSHGTLQIKSFTGSAPPGTLSMTGSFGVLQPGMPVDLELKAVNAQPIVSKLITSNLNADLHLTGSARTRLDVAGTMHLNRTLIGIPNSLPPDVAVLDVRRRGKAAPPAAVKQLVIGLDVAVQAPQQILVQGRGIDIEVGGEMHVSGTTDTPLVSGGFDLQRGNFSLASSRLNFTAGRVSFNGAGLKNKIDPTLDFTATSALADTTVTLTISGFADAPQFEFTSSPPLGQDEIMARLLFGTNAAQLSGLQAAQIAAALASLSGVGGDSGLNPLVKIQKTLGLDRLNIGSGTANTATGTENSGASIEAGRYISKRVYVEAKQTTQGTSQLQADVDLTKHLKLQTRLGNGTVSVQGTTPESDPGSSIGLSYGFEY